MEKRIDEAIVERSLLESRTLAKKFIIEGKVLLNKETVSRASTLVKDTDSIEIIGPKAFVSRGGVKLSFALDYFKFDASGSVALDVGASTGGFTDCLLKRNATKVYALDVGYGQLDYTLRTNPRVVILEKVNARYLSQDLIPEKIDLIVMDVSFISITKILPSLRDLLRDDGEIISLVKPQFEGERKFNRKGIIKDKNFHKIILNSLIEIIPKLGFSVVDATYSPIKGRKGNIEFFFRIKKNGELVNLSLIDKIISEAWELSK